MHFRALGMQTPLQSFSELGHPPTHVFAYPFHWHVAPPPHVPHEIVIPSEQPSPTLSQVLAPHAVGLSQGMHALWKVSLGDRPPREPLSPALQGKPMIGFPGMTPPTILMQ
jgi:hypothetical protein